jgi:hypothetical protein
MDDEVVAKTIRRAADPREWGVDIMSMSFCWNCSKQCVRKAVVFARSQGVLRFTASSNFEFARQDPLAPSSTVSTLLQERIGMMEILRKMTGVKNERRFQVLYP